MSLPLPASQRLLRFGVAGVLGFVVDAGVLYLLAPWLCRGPGAAAP